MNAASMHMKQECDKINLAVVNCLVAINSQDFMSIQIKSFMTSSLAWKLLLNKVLFFSNIESNSSSELEK